LKQFEADASIHEVISSLEQVTGHRGWQTLCARVGWPIGKIGRLDKQIRVLVGSKYCAINPNSETSCRL
jgi:hypothetical protein